MRHLEGKAVVVTGAGRGLGRAYAVHAAGAGAAVVVNDADAVAAEKVVEEIVASSGAAVACGGSVADPAAARNIVELCVSRYGSIDGLVSNAGVFHQAKPWAEDLDRIRTLVDVNLLGTVYCGVAAIERMRKQDTTGSIVNVTSGTHLGHPETAVYGATKGAVASLTYGWALDLLPVGIRVNALSPLAVTDMKLPPYDGHVDPDDVAAVVTYLLSDASAGITGQVVRRARRGLGLLAHPRIGEMIDADAWELDDIDRAFHESLTPLEPIGYADHRTVPARE
ncbi:SDR family NAD(P)-dependent oxidoreductase [Qaidamihabitans albus]|uniref:SDR family NAD(P)-dependent oxidoreductase n=1 Tax=Qaidamihabitans albus TaxID=2795733 RepID=UPI0018F264A1|nr:SDR family oxidoreductase [Qaidamihabitans albus]